MSSADRLDISIRVEIAIHKDDRIGVGQIDTFSSSFSIK